MHVLFLSRWFPYPPDNGSKLRIYHVLRRLSQHHRLSLITYSENPLGDVELKPLESFCETVDVVPWRPFDPRGTGAFWGFLGKQPRSLAATYSAEMERAIRRRTTDLDIGLVIASQIDTAIYLPSFQHLPAILEELEVGVISDQVKQAGNRVKHVRRWLTWLKYRKFIRGLLRGFQACTVVSERERGLVTPLSPSGFPVEVVPNGVELAELALVRRPPVPNTWVYSGSLDFRPNHEAMTWFQSEILPLIRAEQPQVMGRITGTCSGRAFKPEPGIALTGHLRDVRPVIAESWCSIVPLRTGGGTRLKILEAMGLRTPVVATSKGAEGLNVEHGKHLLIADTPKSFAAMVVRLMRDAELRRHLTDNAYALVRSQYDWDVIIPRLLGLIERSHRRRSSDSDGERREGPDPA